MDDFIHVKRKLLEKAKAISETVASGGCTSFESYKERCAEIKAYQEAVKLITQAQKELDDDIVDE